MENAFKLLLAIISFTSISFGLERFKDPFFAKVDTIKNVTYATSVNFRGITEPQILDIYTPSPDTMKKRPCIVIIHGGSFLPTFGDRSDKFAGPASKYLAIKGYVVASIDYRLGWLLTIDAAANEKQLAKASYRALQDSKSAVRFLRKNASTYGIDPDNIYLCGYSAGAITAFNYINLQLEDYLNNKYDTTGLGPVEIGDNLTVSSQVKGVVTFAGAISDTSWIDKNNSLSIAFHGTADETLAYTSGNAFGNTLMPKMYGSGTINRINMTLGNNCKLYTYEGAGHVFADTLVQKSLDTSATLIAAFLNTSAIRSISQNTPKYDTYVLNNSIKGCYSLMGRKVLDYQKTHSLSIANLNKQINGLHRQNK
jgi:dienelactone hydrolase